MRRIAVTSNTSDFWSGAFDDVVTIGSYSLATFASLLSPEKLAAGRRIHRWQFSIRQVVCAMWDWSDRHEAGQDNNITPTWRRMQSSVKWALTNGVDCFDIADFNCHCLHRQVTVWRDERRMTYNYLNGGKSQRGIHNWRSATLTPPSGSLSGLQQHFDEC